jgi:hypothetical protein
VTGAADPSGAAGAAGSPSTPAGADPLTTPISPANLLGSAANAFAPKFLHAAGATPSSSGTTTIVLGGKGHSALIRAGTDFVRNFSLRHEDQLDLRKILHGAPLAHDLANLGNFVRVIGYGRNDPSFGDGIKTTLEVTGPHGSAIVNLEGAGKLELSDLLKHHSLILPPH